MSILISDKVDSRTRVMKERDEHYIMIRGQLSKKSSQSYHVYVNDKNSDTRSKYKNERRNRQIHYGWRLCHFSLSN